MKSKKAKQGSSLLVSLLALTLVTIVATKVFMSVDHQRKILATSVYQDEVLLYLQAGESWAEQILLTEAFNFDDTGLMSVDFELDDGHLFIRLIDLQACININKLTQTELKEEVLGRLYRLSDNLSVSNVWVDVVSDWVDADDEPKGYGKETFDYLSTERPYKAANVMMVSDYEWNMLDIASEELEEVISYVCSLPDFSTSININTASTTILKSMLPNITDSQISYIHRLIEAEDIVSIEELTSDSIVSNLNWADGEWSIGTHFVAVLVNLNIDDKTFWLHSEIAKNSEGIVKPYFRSMMKPNNIVKTRFSIKDALNES